MGDAVTPIITGLQDQVNKLIGTGKALSADDLAAIKAGPWGAGIQSAFDQASAGGDKNSPVYKQKGLDNIDRYTQYWYDHIRNPADYDLAKSTVTPQTTAEDITKTATSQTDGLVKTFTDLTTSLVNGMKDTQTQVGGLVTGLQNDFKTQQGTLLDGFKQAQVEGAKQMSGLVDQLRAQIAGQAASGQAAKKPNYARALAANKALNSGGLSATMLTGPTGVAPGAMSLGATSLLGGA